ncbi:MAG TPA: hypothetical protein VHD83_21845 [Puia sp.]|nr:hypothetical protein [Puia sp.]
METVVLETVLKELLQEQQTNNQIIVDLTGKVAVLTEKVSSFEENQQKLKIVAPPADTSGIEKIAARYFLEFCRLLEAQPKKVVRQVRFLFFPETNTDRYYKIIFGRLLPWGLLFVVAGYLFSLGKRYIDRSTDMQKSRYKYEVYQETLEAADSVLSKTDREKLHVVFKKVEKRHQ